jgi:hypothetical protein
MNIIIDNRSLFSVEMCSLSLFKIDSCMAPLFSNLPAGGGTAGRQTPAYSGLLRPTLAYSNLSQQNYPWGVGRSRLE